MDANPAIVKNKIDPRFAALFVFFGSKKKKKKKRKKKKKKKRKKKKRKKVCHLFVLD